MARIPLAEIPGVANQAGPVLADYPGYRVNLGAGPAAQNASLSRVAANGMQSPIGQGAFNGPAQGMQQMAQAVGSVAPVFSELANKLQVAQNLGDMAKAEAVMENARADHAQEAMTVPADQRVALWETKYRPQAEKQLADLRLSPMAASRVMPQWTTFDAKTRTNISYDAYKDKLQENELSVMNGVNRDTDNGNFEGAISKAQSLKQIGYNDAQVEHVIIGIERKAKDISEQKQNETISTAIETDAASAIPELEKAAKGEASTFGNLEPIKAARFLSKSREVDRSQKISLRNDLHDAVLTGDITDPKILREKAGGKLSEGVLRSLETAMGKEIPFNPETVSTIRTQISNYDPDKDPGLEQYNKIMLAIESTVPQKRQSIIAGELKQAFDEAKGGVTAKAAFLGKMNTEIDGLATRGIFGKYWDGAPKPDEAKSVIDEQKKADVWVKAETYKQGVRDWIKKNPDATPAQAMDYFKGLVGGEASQAAADVFSKVREESGQGWFSKLSDYVSGNRYTGKPDEDTVNMVKGMESFIPKAYSDFKQTSVGYGTRARSSEEVLSEPQADQRLREELMMHASNVDEYAKKVGVKLTKNQRSALISFDFNTGAAAHLLQASGGDTKNIADRMQLYTKAGGKDLPGLIARRKKEVALFNL